MSRKTLFGLLLVPLLGWGCEVNTTVSVDNKVPPTFTVNGSGGIYFLRVYDMTDPKSMDGEWWHQPGIWEIAPSTNSSWIKDIPPITYGVVPTGFVQKTPTDAPAPKLVEGRIYWVWTPSYGANGGGSNKFTLREGKTTQAK